MTTTTATNEGCNELTTATRKLFVDFVKDAGNWSGTPLVGGNVCFSKEEMGNLTDLKKKGLLKTWKDEGCIWVSFTKKAVEYCNALGLQDDVKVLHVS